MDLKLKETGSGGDLIFSGGDIQLTSEIYNQLYLGRFGGNKKASTNDQFLENEERYDYWGNILFLSNNPNEQFNSRFEKSLNEIELSSSGRIKLERIANEDLNYLDGLSTHESEVVIESVDRIKLIDSITNKDNTKFSYIWNEAKDEIIDDNSTYIN